MLNFGSALKGFNQNQDKLNRQRKELAQAFSLFKQNNPEATLADFQYFIDAQTGSGLGSNYIRGGAPSRPLLDQLVKEGETRKSKRLRAEALQSLEAESNAANIVEKRMNQMLIDTSDDKIETGWDEFVTSLGPQGQEIIEGMNLKSKWSVDNRNFLQSQRMMSKLPEIKNYIEMSDYDIDSMTVDDLAAHVGINASQAAPLLEHAKKQVRMEMQNWWMTHNDSIWNRILPLAEQGASDQAIESAIKQLLQDSPLGQKMAKTQDGTVKNMLDLNIKALTDRAKEVRTEKKNAKEIESEKRFNKFVMEAEANPRVITLIQRGDRAGAKAMLNRLRDNAMTEQDRDYVSWQNYSVDDLIDGIVDQLTKEQDATFNEAEDAISKESTIDFRGYKEANAQAMIKALKSAGMSDEVAGQLGSRLGSTYMASRDLVNVIIPLVNGLDETQQGDPELAYQAILAGVQNNPSAVSLNDGLAAAQAQKLEQQTLYEPVTLQQFKDREKLQQTQIVDELVNRLNQAVTKFNSDPQAKISALMALKTQAEETVLALKQEMKERKTRTDLWLRPNSGRYNEGAINMELVVPFEEQIANLQEQINVNIEMSEQQHRRQQVQNNNANPPPEKVDTGDDSETRSNVGAAFERFKNAAQITSAVAAAAQLEEGRAGVMSSLIPDWLERGYIGPFVNLLENTRMTEADRTRLNSKQAWVRKNQAIVERYIGEQSELGNKPEIVEIIQDIQRMDGVELENKYGAMLDQMANPNNY